MKNFSRRYTLAKVVLTHALWRRIWCRCVMQMELFIHTTMESYKPVTHKPLRWGLIKTLNVGSFPQSRVMRAEQATFVRTLEPLFLQKHVLQGSTVALIVWSERALLSPGSDIMRLSALHMICSSLKQDSWNSPGLKQCNSTGSSRHTVQVHVGRQRCWG